MNPGRLPINVRIFKIIRLYRPNCQKMKDFFLLRPLVIICAMRSWGGHSTSHVELFEFLYLLNPDEYTAHQSAISVLKGFY
jgi:hypothetical protein